MAYDRDRWDPDFDYEDEPVYSEDDDGTARSTRRYLDFAAVPDPSSSWGSLVQSGYQVVYALEVEGIPYLFGERELWTTRGAEASARSDDFTMSYALVLDEGVTFSVEADREKGVASGRAVDFVFGRQQLADESLGAAIFARPTLRANLTSTINDPADDTFDVNSTSGWDATGLLYVGRECVRYTSTTSTQFGGCIRGVAGFPHYHTADTVGGYRQCTDTPVFWRGRLVTVWAHLCGPDGRFLGQRWAQHGEWCRQEWRGYVRDAPRPAAGGMVLTCLPLVRLAAQEFGASISGTVLTDYVVSGPADQLSINIAGLAEVIGPDDPDLGIVSLNQWARAAERGLTGTYGIDTYLHWQVIPASDGLRVRVAADADGQALRANAWFLDRGDYLGAAYSSVDFTQWTIPYAWTTGQGMDSGAWLVCEIQPDVDLSEAVLPDAGLLAIEDNQGVAEVAAYDLTRAATVATTSGAGVSSGPRQLVAFRISQRNLLGTDAVARGFNPWRDGGSVRIVSGAVGLWEDCLRTLMTSSGTGSRGDFDVLPNGFGIAIPDDWIAVGGTYAGLVDTIPREEIKAVSTARTSVEDMLGGWLVLLRSGLVQRRNDQGAVVLDVVSTTPVDDPFATVLADTAVLMDGHEAPELVEAPNHVFVTRGDLLTDRPVYVVRDAVRAQAEGVRKIEIKAPGMTEDQALRYGAELILMSDGQSAVTMRLPPWSEVQIGDAVDVTTAHPSLWDWSTGTYAPASLLGRVVGWSREAWSQIQTITVLLAGQAQERVFLCPCARVEQVVSTTVFRVEKGGARGFSTGDEVLLYARGDEDGTTYTRTLDAIDTTSDNYDLFTVDSAIGGLSSTAELVFTFAVYASCVTDQRRLMFTRDDRSWR